MLQKAPSPVVQEHIQILQLPRTTHSHSPSPKASALESAIAEVHNQGRLMAKFRLEIHKECSLCAPDQDLWDL